MTDHDSAFPVEVAQDLLAIARALFVVYRDHGPAFAEQAFKLRGIGSQLNLAIERASEGGPGTFKNRAAWLIAEAAIRDLGELVGDVRGAALIEATGQRLLRRR